MPDRTTPLSGTNPVRLRATVVIEWDADPADYVEDGGAITPAEMAEMDSSMSPLEVVEVGIDLGEITMKIEAVA